MAVQGNPAVSPVTFRPGVGYAYGNGWTQLWKHFGVLLVIGIIVFVIGFVFNIVDWTIRGSIKNVFESIGPYQIVFFLFSIAYSLLIVNPVSYGQKFAYFKAAQGANVQVSDLFEAFKNYGSAVGASLLVGIIIGIGTLLLIIPGIYLGCKLAFVPYLVTERKLSVSKAIDESFRLTSGHAWKVFLIYLLAIPIFIAGLICLVVGVIISYMWVDMAIASLYYTVSMEKSASRQPLPF